MELPVTLIKGDKISPLTDYRDALPVNMYAIEKKILGADGYMLCYPGLTSLGTGQGIDRGGIYNERLINQYRVSGAKMISVSADGTVAVLGTIDGADQAAMPYSFNTQQVIANGKAFLYDPTDGFREITDTDLGDPIDSVWVDGYYFYTDGEFIYHSDINDEEAIDPLKFATAEFMPDPSNGVAKTQDNKVLVFGRYTLEYFVNDASADFSFVRVQTRAQKIGIVATHAKCETGEGFFITGGRRDEAVSVHLLGIGSSVRVATREVDKILSGYTEPELCDMRMECRMEDDITFVLIHLPNKTLCLNVTILKTLGKTVAWSIIKTDVKGDAPYRGINGVFDARSAKWVYGDKLDTTIGLLDNTVFTHYTNMVEWLLFTPFLDLETFSIDEIDIETIPGHTTALDAKVFLSFTYNGLTYGTEISMEYGKPGEINKRFIARRLGNVDDWIGIKLRGATTSRMAFALMNVSYG
jgi:hypothetical protein